MGLAAPTRRSVYGAWLVLLAAASLVVSLKAGEHGPTWLELLQVLRGQGQVVTQWLVLTVRLPRALVALAVGAALGLAGALFQSITRNPLGSPDVMGLTAGASAGAVATIMLWPGLMPVGAAAVAGALLAILLVWLCSGSGFRSPHHMVVAGIGVGAMAFAFVQFSLSSLRRDEALEAALWLHGSLASRHWGDVISMGIALLTLMPLALALRAPLLVLELGDDVAHALGVPVVRTRVCAVVLGVLAAAAAVSVAGPIAFVALAAPPIARMCAGADGPQPLLAASTGAVMLALADLMARHTSATGLPVGIVTAGIGGMYLAFLLVREWRTTAP